jgi:hypothetical protein
MGLPVIMCSDHDRAGVYVSRFLFTAARRRYLEGYSFLNDALKDSKKTIDKKPVGL